MVRSSKDDRNKKEKVIYIRNLSGFDRDSFLRIVKGYTSNQKYQVVRGSTPRKTTISLKLTKLSKPYEKIYEYTELELLGYEKLVSEGLSIGAFDGERMIGVSIGEYHVWNKSFWVWDFHVDPDFKRHHIGTMMMDEIEKLAVKSHARCIVCETQNTNVPAIKFYRKVGFEIEGVDLSYYTNNDVEGFEVAIFMKKKLSR